MVQIILLPLKKLIPKSVKDGIYRLYYSIQEINLYVKSIIILFLRNLRLSLVDLLFAPTDARLIRKTLKHYSKFLAIVSEPEPEPEPEPEQRVPFIFINTLPKSGSTFIMVSLCKGLGIPTYIMSHGYFPYDLIDMYKLADFSARGNTLSKGHIDPSPMNLQLLTQYSPKFVLHIRDPRQSLVSWAHMYLKSAQNLNCDDEEAVTKAKFQLSYFCPSPPDDLYAKPMQAQYDWYIDHYLPASVLWINQWLEILNSRPDLNILLTRYEDFCVNNQSFLLKILDFYGIPHDCYTQANIEKNPSILFRKGLVDEWKQEFSLAQQERASQVLQGPITKYYW